MRTANIDRLLDILYASATQPEAIGEFLAEVSAVTQSHAASICAHDPAGTGGPLLDWKGISATEANQYAERYASNNIWIERTLAQQGSGNVIVTDDWISKADLHRSVYWREFLRLIDVDHCVALCSVAPSNQVSVLNLVRSQRRGQYTDTEASLLRRLSPHWVNMCTIQIALDVNARRVTAAEKTLMRSSLAIYFLAENGSVIWMNPRASRLVEVADFVSLRRKHLACASFSDDRKLHAAILSCIQRATARSSMPAHNLTLHDENGVAVAFAAVHSFGQARSVFGGHARAAATVWIRPLKAKGTATLSASLSALFGLTRSESVLAASLYELSDLERAASACAITSDTARTRLKLIFDKTSTHSQPALVTLISQLVHVID